MIVRRLLIANRGEIAVRIIGTCRRLGIETVVAASDADLDAVPARLADRVVRLGPPPASASYLDVDAVVDAAVATGCDAVHPGYGFLAENQRLAGRCDERGVVFVGPSASQLAALGDKLSARRHALEAGLPIVPGGEVSEHDGAHALATELGFPVVVKAVGGGGGRGMQRVDEAARLTGAIERGMAESEAAFGDARVYLERFVTSGRHVEVQVLGDGARVVHLGDRDCSVQRRYQKLIEEAPAPDLDDDLRAGMHRAAVALASHLAYRGAGTVEFLVDRDRGAFHFLEMNARIQVEHPVTEAITGVDLVAEQLAVAEGRPLRLTQDDLAFDGHAIECRINAEDWTRDFTPDPGLITGAAFPVGPGIRVDTHVQTGTRIPPFYDSLLAKLIVHAPTRDVALARLRTALGACAIDGIATTLAMHAAVTRSPAFLAGAVDTSWFARFLSGDAGDAPSTSPAEAGA